MCVILVCAHHLTLALAAQKGWSAAHVRTKEHQDHEEPKALPARLLVPFQQPPADHQAQVSLQLGQHFHLDQPFLSEPQFTSEWLH